MQARCYHYHQFRSEDRHQLITVEVHEDLRSEPVLLEVENQGCPLVSGGRIGCQKAAAPRLLRSRMLRLYDAMCNQQSELVLPLASRRTAASCPSLAKPKLFRLLP